MSGLIQQLVDEMKDFPAMRWKNVKTEKPNKKKLLLVIPTTWSYPTIPVVVKYLPNLPQVWCGGDHLTTWALAHSGFNDPIRFEYYIELENIPIPKNIKFDKKYD